MWRRADDSVKIELQKFEAGLSDENLNRVKEVHELSRLLGSGRTCSRPMFEGALQDANSGQGLHILFFCFIMELKMMKVTNRPSR